MSNKVNCIKVKYNINNEIDNYYSFNRIPNNLSLELNFNTSTNKFQTKEIETNDKIYSFALFQQITNYDMVALINCSYNDIVELPKLPINIQELYCYNCNLILLSKLPKSLKILDCRYNQLTSLPELPNSLQILYCDNNKLISLPKLPKSLEFLKCETNQLSELPELPIKLQKLYCYNNKIKWILNIPKLMSILQYDYDKFIKNIKYKNKYLYKIIY
jgi:Leucine-rich repeat (LRR) protein